MRMNSYRPAFAVAALSLLSGCGEVLFAEVDIPEVCSRLPAQTIPGGPDIVGSVSPTVRLEIDVTDALPEDAELIDADVRLKRAMFRVPGGTGDLSFLDALRLDIASTEGGIVTDSRLVDWTRTSESDALTELELVGNDSVNLYPFTQAGQLGVALGVTITPPPEATELEPVLCMGVKGRVNYGEAL